MDKIEIGDKVKCYNFGKNIGIVIRKYISYFSGERIVIKTDDGKEYDAPIRHFHKIE